MAQAMEILESLVWVDRIEDKIDSSSIENQHFLNSPSDIDTDTDDESSNTNIQEIVLNSNNESALIRNGVISLEIGRDALFKWNEDISKINFEKIEMIDKIDIVADKQEDTNDSVS
jgi:hypothetical protein